MLCICLMLCMGGLLSYVGDLMLNRLVNGSTNKSGWIHGVKWVKQLHLDIRFLWVSWSWDCVGAGQISIIGVLIVNPSDWNSILLHSLMIWISDTFADSSADPQASVEPMTPIKQEEHHEEMVANSESMVTSRSVLYSLQSSCLLTIYCCVPDNLFYIP